MSATMSSRSSPEDSQLIEQLMMLCKKSPRLVKSSEFAVPGAADITVHSWKMNEFKYYDVPSPFPTLARGLFTLPEKCDGKPLYRIVARGYDKFFNIGEVPWTTWEALEAHTGPPYTLSLKSNGCIIFIAAITPTLLIVTSKHSLGAIGNAAESHSQAGYRWLKKHLESKGRTEEQLAQTLWNKDLTAVAELCDDSFEEHVLPYAPEKTGLHLHGLNKCSRHFDTLPPSEVDAFAKEWGFISTPTITLDNIPAVQKFTSEIAKTGKWNGEALEGFVVRTHVISPTTGDQGARTTVFPYAAGSSFFFKVKFDEPYIMYRDWRELTKMLLSKGSLSAAQLPKGKMRRPETKLYVSWVIEEIKHNHDLFKNYTKGKGIIATRERFLKWLEENKGQEALSKVGAGSSSVISKSDETKLFGKTIIVPIAIPGCGKTTVSVALSHLFGFGHTQSDDVHAKKAAPVFIRNVVDLLKDHDVVIADKNNHLRQHRQQLRDATARFSPPVQLLALNWALEKPQATLHRICGDRISNRGANHQTLRANLDPTKAREHEDVIWMFLRQAEPLADEEVDASVDIDVEDSMETMLQTAVNACVEVLGVERPSQPRMQEALQVAQAYQPAKKKPDDASRKRVVKEASPRYFALLPEIDLEEVLAEQIMVAPKEARDFWKHLSDSKRLARVPHVTIVHRNTLPVEWLLWESCTNLQQVKPQPLFRVCFGHLVWNTRIMAVTVDSINLESGGPGQEGQSFISRLPEEVRSRLHVTVGTRDDKVSPVEAKNLVEAWRKGTATKDSGVFKLQDITVKGRVKGAFN